MAFHDTILAEFAFCFEISLKIYSIAIQLWRIWLSQNINVAMYRVFHLTILCDPVTVYTTLTYSSRTGLNLHNDCSHFWKLIFNTHSNLCPGWSSSTSLIRDSWSWVDDTNTYMLDSLGFRQCMNQTEGRFFHQLNKSIKLSVLFTQLMWLLWQNIFKVELLCDERVTRDCLNYCFVLL